MVSCVLPDGREVIVGSCKECDAMSGGCVEGTRASHPKLTL